MTGLFDIFWRHLAVLTNFLRNVMESRPYWLRGGNPQGPRYREGWQGQTDRAPQGWYLGPSPPPSPCWPTLPGRPGPVTTHSSPDSGLPGPASLSQDPPRACWVGGYYPPPPTHLYRTTRARRTTCRQQCGADSRFDTVVGEPRGTRTQPFQGSQTGYIQLFEV